MSSLVMPPGSAIFPRNLPVGGVGSVHTGGLVLGSNSNTYTPQSGGAMPLFGTFRRNHPMDGGKVIKSDRSVSKAKRQINFHNQSLKSLRKLAKNAGLRTSGNKKDLITRLEKVGAHMTSLSVNTHGISRKPDKFIPNFILYRTTKNADGKLKYQPQADRLNKHYGVGKDNQLPRGYGYR